MNPNLKSEAPSPCLLLESFTVPVKNITMRIVRRVLPTIGVVIFVAAGLAIAGQFGRDFNRAFGYIPQNDPPPTEFIFARWSYTSGGYGGWEHDYPSAEQHILQIMKETVGINVERMSYRVVELSSPEIFDYPFSYISEPGTMRLTNQEVDNLREYINRGGFIMVDDFGGQGQGQWEFETLRSTLRQAFPGREMFELTVDHPLFHTFYDIDSVQAVHPMSGARSIFLGFPDDEGRVAMVICYAADVGDFWEHIDSPRYPVRPSAEALKLGIDFVMYAMTH